MSHSRPSLLPWLILACIWIVLDQISKYWIVQTYQPGEYTVISSFFNIVRVHNHGAAFSFLAGAGGWQRWFFTIIGLAASAALVWMLHTRRGDALFPFAAASIMGGALGNVIDRIQHGYVVDMLDFHWQFLTPLFYQGHFPAFNVADTAITLGAAGVILDEIIQYRKTRAAQGHG